jgi:acid phosphatase
MPQRKLVSLLLFALSRLRNIFTALALCTLAALQVACGGGGSPTVQTPVPSNQPTFSHVVLLVEENHSYSEVIGNSANNVVRELVKAGKTWKCYAESIPAPGYVGADSGVYVRRHNPFSYLSDVQNNSAQAANIVPFTQFATDLANNTLPQYSFIAPNVDHDAHNGSLAQADTWLQSHVIVPLTASPAFQSTLLIITFDEGNQADLDHLGGHVATVIVSPKAKKGFQSSNTYQHQSTLRLILAGSGVNSFPGLSAGAPDMTEFFTGP